MRIGGGVDARAGGGIFRASPERTFPGLAPPAEVGVRPAGDVPRSAFATALFASPTRVAEFSDGAVGAFEFTNLRSRAS